MTDTHEYDVAVVGGGPGGMTAALSIAARGLKVVLIEDRLVGGECHYWACIPTKALLRPIEVLALARAVPGVRELMSDDHPDLAAVFAKRDEMIDHLADDALVSSVNDSGVDVLHGHGRLAGPREVTVEYPDGRHDSLTMRYAVVLVTGTSNALPDVPGLADAQPWTNRELSIMTHVPPRTLVVGGGVVGVEFATILAGLGSDVTLLVRGASLLPNSESVVAEMVSESLLDMGVNIQYESELSTVSRVAADGLVTATFGDQHIEVDEIVVATGRKPNTDDLGLETVGLRAGEYVTVDDHLQALDVEGQWLYALGDTTGRALLSHISQYHARIVGDVIAARAQGSQLLDDQMIARETGVVPQVIFTDPQVIEVGRTEAVARADGFAVKTRTARYPGDVPQLAIFRDGFVGWGKLVIDADTDTLLGATFVGPQFAELVQAASLAVLAKVPMELLRHVVAPHPTVNQVWDPLFAAGA